MGKAEGSKGRQEKRVANNLHSSPYIARVAKPRTMRWAGNEQVVVRREMPTVFWWGSLNERYYMQDLNTFSSSLFLLGPFHMFTAPPPMHARTHARAHTHTHTHTFYIYTQGVPGGKDLTSGECSLGQTIPI